MHPEAQNGAETQISEIELDTNELAEMKPVPANSASFAKQVSAQTPVQAKAAQPPRARPPRTAFVGAAFAVTAVAAILYSTSHESETAPHIAWPKLSLAKSAADIEADTQETLVRIQNPFDKTEIFEFPSGTSKATAREAVADILLKRGQERQTLFAANGKR
jgi:hypothetical protein